MFKPNQLSEESDLRVLSRVSLTDFTGYQMNQKKM